MTRAPYLVLAVGGTGESWPGDTRTDVVGMTAYITGELDPAVFDSRWVGYDSTYGPLPYVQGVSYTESVARGLHALIQAIELHSDGRPVILIGYSQGAAVVSTLLDLCAGAGPSYPGEPTGIPAAADRILAAALVANPQRKPGTGPTNGITVKGYGITYDPAKPTPDRIVPVAEIASPNDAIASADPDSMLRSIAKVTDFMSFVDLHAWGVDLYNEAKAIDWKAEATSWLDWPRQYDRAKRAALEAFGYLTGRHTSYNVELVPGLGCTYTQLAADWIDAQVDFYEDAREEYTAA